MSIKAYSQVCIDENGIARVLLFSYEDNAPYYELEVDDIKDIYNTLIRHGKVIPDGFATVYGYDTQQVIIWGELLRECGMDKNELKNKIDLFKLGYEMCDKEYKRSMQNVIDKFSENISTLFDEGIKK